MDQYMYIIYIHIHKCLNLPPNPQPKTNDQKTNTHLHKPRVAFLQHPQFLHNLAIPDTGVGSQGPYLLPTTSRLARGGGHEQGRIAAAAAAVGGE